MRRTGTRRPSDLPAANGFTLPELLVSFLILIIAMTIAGRLLLESQARMAHSARRATEPVATIALKQIRADVRASGSVTALDHEWSWEPLVLLGHPAGVVTYERVGRDLVRGVGTGERIVLREVSIWRWRLSAEAPLPLVEIELGHREIPRFALLAAIGRREAPIPVTRSYLVAVSPRRAGRTGW